ncbi:MAG: FAD-binding domain-containing protein [Akkermansiaceae bacterium]
MIPIPTRSAALEKLEKFVPLAAKYAGRRNFDLGRGSHDGVSQLSPYIRARLITEEECTRAILAEHTPRAAEKFLQEIAWRTYWKGWLEMRPGVWRHYLDSLSVQERSRDCESAVSGETGIECFDHWVRELVETGYLHNHTRMWFASIWIFTLKLPWQLGADFFLNHLLDGDPASNTLSWRWVAGLHTKGKHYLARASNIEKFTNGRFNPVGQLDETASPIEEDLSVERETLDLAENPRPEIGAPMGRVGHLMFSEDLATPHQSLGEIHATAAYIPPALRTTPLVTEFLSGAVDDALSRTQGALIQGPFQEAVKDWVRAESIDTVVISRPTVGHVCDFLDVHPIPADTRVFTRDWDRLLWPHASAGFFKLKKALPKIHASLAPSREGDLFPEI